MSFSNYNTVSLLVNLPVTANSNDCYFVAETSKWYYYNGTNWIVLNDNLISLEHRILALESATISASGITDGDKGDVVISNNGTNWLVPDLVDLDNRVTTLENTPNSNISDGDKGDITVTGNGTIWTVDNLNSKQDTLISGTNIKTINNQSILGSGNIVIESSGGNSGNVQADYTELWLKFNGANNSTDFVDDSKNNYSIVPVGTPIISTSESKFGGSSLYLNGSSQLTLCPINFKGDFTIECWVKTNNTNWNPIISQCQSGIPANTWVFYTNNNSVYHGNYSSSSPLIQSSFNSSDNAWHHITFVRKNNSFYLFIDGLLKIAENRVILNSSTSLITRIGNDGVNSSFTGYIDNLKISSKAIYTPTLYPNGFTLPDENFNVTAL